MKQKICILLVGMLALTSAEAQNYAKKLKKASGIEVVYRSVYKGKTYPGGMVMTVCGDQVKLENLSADGKSVAAVSYTHLTLPTKA